MKRSSVLAAALMLTFATAAMATVAPEETTAVAPAEAATATAQTSVAPAQAAAATDQILLAHEKSEPKEVLKTDPPAEPAGVTGDVYIGPLSKYVFRGNNLSATGDFVIQGGIDLVYKGFTLSYWGNAQNRYPDDTYDRAKLNETDLILDYAVPYTLPYLDNLKFNIGTVYYAVDAIDDTNEFYLKASYDTLLKPTLAVYWDNLAATDDGLFFTGSVSHKFSIAENLLSLNLGALAGYNQRNPSAAYTPEGDGVYSGWHNFELTASFDYTPTANITITPSYLFSNALSGNAKDIGINDQNVYALKVMFAF